MGIVKAGLSKGRMFFVWTHQHFHSNSVLIRVFNYVVSRIITLLAMALKVC